MKSLSDIPEELPQDCITKQTSMLLKFIQTTINKHQIDCDFTQQDAYLYATTEEYAYKLEKKQKLIKSFILKVSL